MFDHGHGSSAVACEEVYLGLFEQIGFQPGAPEEARRALRLDGAARQERHAAAGEEKGRNAESELVSSAGSSRIPSRYSALCTSLRRP